jgi:membrane-bound lytic murein transglycosylase A
MGQELIWLGDPFEVYIAHVQGSAKIRLPDGSLRGVGYAASNGHEYKSLSKEMVKQGKISGQQMSLSAMIDYFKKHPDEVAGSIQINPRFVFFMEEKGEPRGSLNEEVTLLRSVATDKSIFPPASLTFISTKLPYEKDDAIIDRPYTGFALDQDTGGAIRAAGRCDVYMGVGDKAGKLAGRVYQEGRLYYLFVK